MRRAGPALLLWLAALLASSAPAAAASSQWQISASPTSFQEGQATRVVLTVTGGSLPIGLLTVTIPSGYRILGAAVLSVPAGEVWLAKVSSPTLVTFQTNTAVNHILQGQVGRFAITVIATSLTPPAWIAASYRQSAIPGNSVGRPLSALPAFKILAPPTPTLSPAASRTPSPTPSPSPTPETSATPEPSASATAGPSEPASTPGTGAGAGASQAPTGTSPPGAGVAIGTNVYTGGGTQVVIPTLAPGENVGVSGLDNLSTLSLYSWLVPGFFLGLPGLLVVLIVLFQIGAGGLFLPVVRVVLGGFGFRRRSRGEAAD